MKKDRERVIVHLDMDAFFASVEQRAHPALRGRPVIVSGNPWERSVVATSSYEARARGVKTGMPLAQARRICPEAAVLTADGEKYVHTSNRIFRHLCRYTPAVEAISVDEAFMDVTGTEHFFGGVEAAARLIKDWIRREFGLTCSIGIGPNKLIARLASGMEKPDGMVRIRADRVPAVLEKLPVDAICGIGGKLREQLRMLGITTCGELGRAPVETLNRKFGIIIGTGLKQMGAGIDSSGVIPNLTEKETPKSMGHLRTLARDTADMEKVKIVLFTLSEKVGRRLRSGHCQGRTITLTLRFADFFTFSRSLTIGHYCDDGREIYRVCCLILSRLNLVHRRIRMVGVSVSGLVNGQRQLYLIPEAGRREKLLEAVDLINDRWGEFTLAPGTVMTGK